MTIPSDRKTTYAWLSVPEILALHEKLIALFGGASGIREIGLLTSAIDPSQMYSLYEESNIFELAATYADGIIRNHPFVDGNKRTGFVAAILFLESNDVEFFGEESEAALMTRGLADRSVTREQFAEWLKEKSKE